MNKLESINERKLQIKYYLNIYKLLDIYPTEDDVLFELSIDFDIINGKSFSIKKVEKLLDVKGNNVNIKKILTSLEEQNYIEVIKKSKKEELFKLLKHKW